MSVFDDAKNLVDSVRAGGRSDQNDNRSSSSLFNNFSRQNYDIYDFEIDPQKDDIIAVTNEGIPYRFAPRMIEPWRTEYFTTPYGKARLFRHMVVAFIISFATLFVSLINHMSWETAIGTVVFFLLFLNFAFRYYGGAVYKWPMPEIPFFSGLLRDTEDYEFTIMAENVYATEGIDFHTGKTFEQLDKEEQAQRDVEASGNYVRRVHTMKDGVPSPATILSRYMNDTLHWTAKDMEDATGRIIDTTTLELLLDDNVVAWNDTDIIDALCEQTNSTPQEWKQAYKEFHGA